MPIVPAGLRCASLLPQAIAVNTPAITAITIQPAPSAFDRLRNTFATTPLPNSINMSVPMNSPTHSSTSKTPYSEEVLPGLMCLDFDQSLSDGNHATPFGSFIWGSGNRVKKAKG